MADIDALLEVLLAKARRVAQQAEVYALDYRETPVQFEANRLKSLMTRQGSGLALRIVKDGRTGFASTTRTDQVDELLAMAVETAGFGAEARFELPARPADGYPDVTMFDLAVEQEPVAAMVAMGQAMIDRVRAHTPDLLCEAGVSMRVSTVRLANSAGLDLHWTRTVSSLSLDGTLVRGTDMLFVGDERRETGPVRTWQAVADETIRQLEMARELVDAPEGLLPVVFTPRALAEVFIEPLTIALSGRTVVQGASPLGQKRGELVFDPGLTVYDDPTHSGRPGSRFADDEGVPARRIDLVHQGRVGSFVYDLQTAGLAGAKSTGSAGRGLGNLPTPAYHLLRVAPGAATLGGLLAGVKDGLLVDMLLGGGQGNVLGGDFSGNVLLGYRVQNGRVLGRVKNTMIAGNIYEAFREGVVVGSGPEWVGGGLETPYILCPRVAVSSGE